MRLTDDFSKIALKCRFVENKCENSQKRCLEACDTVLLIGHLLGRYGLSEDFTVTALKCRANDKYCETG